VRALVLIAAKGGDEAQDLLVGALDDEDPLVLAAGGGTKTQGTRRYSTDNQITWQVSNRNKVAFNFRADPLTQTNVGISAVTPQESTEKQQSGGPTYTMTWTAPYSPALLVDSTVAYQDTHIHLTPTQSGVQNNCFHNSPFLKNAQCFNTQNGTVSGSSPRDWDDSRQRLTVKSDATYYKGRLWGAVHQFKFGLAIENERYFRELQQHPTFQKQTTLGRPGETAKTSFSINAAVDDDSHQRALGTAVGIYGEDVIRPITNLSVTVGLRVEQENVNGPGYRQFDPQAESDALPQASFSLEPELDLREILPRLRGVPEAIVIGAEDSIVECRSRADRRHARGIFRALAISLQSRGPTFRVRRHLGAVVFVPLFALAPRTRFTA
jgi:hypothetical protein